MTSKHVGSRFGYWHRGCTTAVSHSVAGWGWQGVPQAWVIEIQKVLDFYGLDILTFSMINLSFIYQTNKQNPQGT